MSVPIGGRQRLSPLDASFLYLDDVPRYVASLGLLEPTADGPLTYQRLSELVEQRLPLVPRYRQRIRRVPGGVARPVWVDDAGFELGHHLRRAELPRPGTMEQLHELVARVSARRLDHRRPMWDMHLIEGLADGRTAVLSRTHEAMIDGAAVDLMQVLYDTRPGPRRVAAQRWQPAPEPGDVALLADAIADLVRRPTELLHTVRTRLSGAGQALTAVAGVANDVLAVARTAARPAPESPLNHPTGAGRRFSTLRTDLADYRAVRERYEVSVTDVVLASVAGGLRSWSMMRGAALTPTTVVRAMVPVSVRAGVDESAVGSGENRVSAVLIDLPVGEPNPVMRLHQVAYGLHTGRHAGHFVRADRMIALSGFAPPTLHALGVKAASRFSRRLYNLLVTNVPGPQEPLYLAGARLSESYPVVPLGPGQGLAVGITSYHGRVCYGLNADRDSITDLDVLADLIEESLAELVEAAT